MDARDDLEQIIDQRQGRLAAGILPDREAALLALLRAIDRLPPDRDVDTEPDVVTGRRMPGLGVPLALRLCLEGPGVAGAVDDPDRWAADFLDNCRGVEAAALVHRFSETGAMRLMVASDGAIVGWLAGRSAPALWRERFDIDWWARWIAAREPLPAGTPGDPPEPMALAEATVRRMAYQLAYPPDGVLGGCKVRLYRDVLAALIAAALTIHDAGESTLVLETDALVRSISTRLGADPGQVERAIAAMALDAGNAAWHAALPGGPQAPLVRLDDRRLALSRRGLLTEPLFFLARELRRCDPEGYHNSAQLREVRFREDLYGLFGDSRYVTSPGRLVLRWDDRRNRTDVDAAVFDRKSGTLAVFELKSQDPLARSAAETERRRENLRRAGQQVGGTLDWLNRHGADELLSRVDRQAAKRYRVQRVLPFVLGRYVADPGNGAPAGRAAWGTWPQVLRLMDGLPDGNPLAGLHARLVKDAGGGAWRVADAAPVDIALGDRRLAVYPSWAAVQAAAAATGPVRDAGGER